MTDSIHMSASKQARTQLHREHMSDFGHEIDWLRDPNAIPEHATGMIGQLGPYANVAAWMIESLITWSDKTHGRLNYGAAFDKYDLSGPQRCQVRDQLREQVAQIYTPGIMAIAELHAVTPPVAVREGYEDPDDWSRIASSARGVGTELARRGTHTQGTLRDYLGIVPSMRSYRDLDPAKFLLDDEGSLTTVVPVKQLLDTAWQANVDALGPEHNRKITCPALYSKVKGLGGITMFDAVWDAFGQTVDRHISPKVSVDRSEVAAIRYPELSKVRNDIEEIADAYAAEMLPKTTVVQLGDMGEIASVLASILNDR